MTLAQMVVTGTSDFAGSYGPSNGSAIPLIVEWATNPVTVGLGVIACVAIFFHWLGKRSGRQIIVGNAATPPSAEELRKAEMERQVKRRRASLNIISKVVYKAIVRAHKDHVRNPNAGLNAIEAYSVAGRIFNELRSPDLIEAIKKDLGLLQTQKPGTDAPPATPATAPAEGPTAPPVETPEQRMARVKERMAQRQKAA